MRKNLLVVWLLAGLAVALAAYFWPARQQTAAGISTGAGRQQAGDSADDRPVAVQVAEARQGDMAVSIDALGTVVAHNTALVRARVDGQLLAVNFREGQMVQAGEVLALIDPRPYQAALDQASGQLRRDEALLANARLDLERFRDLLSKDSIARQQVDAQAALVQQYEGVVQAGRAQVADARLQLDFTRITAPLSGRLGLRQVDAGNMVRAADTNGIVTITQTRPIDMLFAIPAARLDAVRARWHAGDTLQVEALEREGGRRLAQGKLLTIDNQIDPATGTVRLKAQFANADQALFPNQFVNARLTVATLRKVVLAPSAAIHQGVDGSFVHVVDHALRVSVRKVRPGVQSAGWVVIDQGLRAGERLVIDGADKLREGSLVEIPGAGTVDKDEHEAALPAGGRR
ncbi:multidrug efflux system, subunit A [Sterolibacterium denitrificans]|uniref:Multidrug efflux system, subunit A n=1 Tax=Sterolibacterium denitrificans TaxID=157592 RepID=A0A7Z7HSN3_9PROT|nr:MdtA/MuxA family multidrug efflux RND transporter periplasmic adaptor subunit [Sterolibacterium denitrificans]SMB28752.1 multidrug efflux system, subunit A [Sterolibacterium denitrificans]